MAQGMIFRRIVVNAVASAVPCGRKGIAFKSVPKIGRKVARV